MQQSYPGVNPSIEQWKGQEIIDFQEDLRIKVRANISEKWFYTHMKSSTADLPRIDMLNFLSRYSGYANWDDFVFRNRDESQTSSSLHPANRYFILVPIMVLVVIAILYGLYKLFSTREYQFTFIDADTREHIKNEKMEVILLSENESPLHSFVDSNGCFYLKTDKSRIRLVIRAPYYQTDTLERIVKKFNRSEKIILKPKDYDLMIHFFSTMKVDDWQKRRNSLDKMIDDGALIYQVFKGKEEIGMALYNKQEFIDRLTIPTGTLKNIEVLHSQYRDGKIIMLRFRIN